MSCLWNNNISRSFDPPFWIGGKGGTSLANGWMGWIRCFVEQNRLDRCAYWTARLYCEWCSIFTNPRTPSIPLFVSCRFCGDDFSHQHPRWLCAGDHTLSGFCIYGVWQTVFTAFTLAILCFWLIICRIKTRYLESRHPHDSQPTSLSPYQETATLYLLRILRSLISRVTIRSSRGYPCFFCPHLTRRHIQYIYI